MITVLLVWPHSAELLCFISPRMLYLTRLCGAYFEHTKIILEIIDVLNLDNVVHIALVFLISTDSVIPPNTYINSAHLNRLNWHIFLFVTLTTSTLCDIHTSFLIRIILNLIFTFPVINFKLSPPSHIKYNAIQRECMASKASRHNIFHNCKHNLSWLEQYYISFLLMLFLLCTHHK